MTTNPVPPLPPIPYAKVSQAVPVRSTLSLSGTAHRQLRALADQYRAPITRLVDHIIAQLAAMPREAQIAFLGPEPANWPCVRRRRTDRVLDRHAVGMRRAAARMTREHLATPFTGEALAYAKYVWSCVPAHPSLRPPEFMGDIARPAPTTALPASVPAYEAEAPPVVPQRQPMLRSILSPKPLPASS